MLVDAENCQTVDEQLDEIDRLLNETGNFFSFDVHPNVVRADNILTERLEKKRKALVNSEEYRSYHQ